MGQGSMNSRKHDIRDENLLDDTDSDGLSHVTDGESTKRRVVGEGLNAKRLGGYHLYDSSV